MAPESVRDVDQNIVRACGMRVAVARPSFRIDEGFLRLIASVESGDNYFAPAASMYHGSAEGV